LFIKGVLRVVKGIMLTKTGDNGRADVERQGQGNNHGRPFEGKKVQAGRKRTKEVR